MLRASPWKAISLLISPTSVTVTVPSSAPPRNSGDTPNASSYQAFFSAQPVEVENFASFGARGLVVDAVGPGLFWLVNLAGAGQELPAPWALTMPVLVFRLLWFVWAIAAGFLLYREGREVLRGVANHWRRAWPAKE